MKRLILFAALAAGIIGSALAQQGPAAIVEAVQAPAWVERGGARLPVTPGMRLQDNDQVLTGADARLLLRMPEGSTVKLGEHAKFRLESQRMPQRNVYVAAMNVAEGAFRFTTDVLARFRGKRDVNIRFPTVTAGIRGTDVWGKSASDREIVCLIDGRVEVQRDADKPVTLDKPLLFYIAPKGQPALPVGPVPPAQLKEWAAETEIQPGRGALRRTGRWHVVLASVETQAEALKVYDAARGAGFAAEIRPQEAEGKKSYDVRLPGLPSESDAKALSAVLRGRFAEGEPSVSR